MQDRARISDWLANLLQPLLRPVPNSFFGYEHFPSAGCAPHPCFTRIDQHRISLPKECSHSLPRHVRYATGSSAANLVNKPQPSESERSVGRKTKFPRKEQVRAKGTP
jgi:hypothetical protein